MTNRMDDICSVIQTTLEGMNANAQLSELVTADSAMGTPREWDSLAFVSIFMALTEHFQIEVDEDEAIHFLSVRGINSFLDELMPT